MTNFESDLSQEAILSKYLDQVYKNKDLEFERIFDLNKQHQGIDIIMMVNSNEYFIDEKAQLHYLNNDLPTFTFELSYLKNGEYRKGWLFDKNKLTEYYFLITGIILKKGKTKLLVSDDIESVKITSVNRGKLINHLALIGLGKDKLLEYDSEIRINKTNGKNPISELNPNSEGLIYFSEKYKEEPINLQLRLNFLIKNNFAKELHYV